MSKYLVILHDAQDNSLPGREELKLRLCEALKIAPQTVDRLLTSLPVILRRDLDLGMAEKYAEALERLGAVVEAIEQVDGVTDELLQQVLPVGAVLGFEEAAPPAPRIQKPSHDSSSELTFSAGDSDDAVELSALETMLDDALQADPPVESPARNPVVESSEPPPLIVNTNDRPDGFSLGIELDDSPTPAAPRDSLFLDMLNDGAPPVQKPQKVSPVVVASPPPAVKATQAPAPVAAPAVPPASAADRSQPPPAAMSAFARPAAEPETPEVETRVTSRNDARKSKRGWMLIGLGGVLVLFLAQPLILNALGFGGGPRMTLSLNVEALLKEQRSILGIDSTEGSEHQEIITGQWVGELIEAGVNSRLRLTEIDDKLALASLDVTTERPPKLTEQQLIAGKPLPTWLRRVEAMNLRRTQQNIRPGDKVTFFGNGRAYLEDGKGADRILLEVELVLTAPQPADRELRAEWILRHSVEPQGKAPDSPNELMRLGAKDWRVFFRGKSQVTRERMTKPQPQEESKQDKVSQREAKK